MIELIVKTPVNDDIVFSDIVTINYEVKDTTGLFSKVVFEVNNQTIVKTTRTGLFQVTLPEGDFTLVAYIKNKYDKELLETRKTISFSTKPVTLELKNKLSSVVSSSIPDFLEQDYQTFVDFIKYYYLWLESTKNVNLVPHTLEQYFDVDTIPPELIDRFTETYLNTFPREFSIDKETGSSPDLIKIIKRIKDFYSKKGTEDSFRFLFRVMFDTEITLTYPREKLLKASQAEWIVPKFIRAKNLSEASAAQLVGTEVYSLDTQGSKTFSAIIDDCNTFYHNNRPITTLNLINVLGNLTDSKVYYTKIVEGIEEEYSIDLYSMIVDYELYECPDPAPGSTGKYDFAVGQKIILTRVGTFVICGQSGNSLSDKGCQIFYELYPQEPPYIIPDFGYGLKAYVDEVNEKGEILKIKIDDPGFNWTQETIRGYSVSVGQIERGEFIPAKLLYTGDNIVYDCRLYFKSGYIFTQKGRYKSKKSLLSQIGILQDNFYYQQNSYEIGSNVTPYKFSDVLKQNVHPAGYKAFYAYNILDTVIEKREVTVPEPGAFDIPTGVDSNGNTVGLERQTETIEGTFQTGNGDIGLSNLRLGYLNIPVEETIYTTDLVVSTNDIPEDSDGIVETPIEIPYVLYGKENSVDPRL